MFIEQTPGTNYIRNFRSKFVPNYLVGCSIATMKIIYYLVGKLSSLSKYES